MAKKNSKNKKPGTGEPQKEKIRLGTRDPLEACLPFERPVVELEKKINELRASSNGGIDLSGEIESLQKKLEKALKEIYDNLTPWQRVQVARHPLRPYTLDYVKYLAQGFFELHGDRHFSDDRALVTGFAKWEGKETVCVVGQQKGRDTKENLLRSFGSAHPEGYRKAIRIMRLAEKFGRPILCFIDTPGAYPGIGAEERGQAHSIAYNMREMARLRTPIYVCVIGEGGSGGALGVGVGDWSAMLEHAYYSVISPEGCAAILWRDRARAPDAAAALKLTANDLLQLGVVDEMLDEPLGGAHRDPEMVAQRLRASMLRFLKMTDGTPLDELLERRYGRFRKIGVFSSHQAALLAPTAA